MAMDNPKFEFTKTMITNIIFFIFFYALWVTRTPSKIILTITMEANQLFDNHILVAKITYILRLSIIKFCH